MESVSLRSLRTSTSVNTSLQTTRSRKSINKHEKMLDINKIMDVKGKTLMFQPDIEEIKHEPDITHMLKGIKQSENKIFDHNFAFKSC